MRYALKALEMIARGIHLTFLLIGFGIALPFWMIANFFEDRADDLRGDWVPGRRRNALQAWARKLTQQ